MCLACIFIFRGLACPIVMRMHVPRRFALRAVRTGAERSDARCSYGGGAGFADHEA